MRLLLRNIKTLWQSYDQTPGLKTGAQMTEVAKIENAFLYIADGRIESFGFMNEMPDLPVDENFDASGRMVLPAYIDSHTHLVFPEYRDKEFELKIKGATYEEIAAAGGGILNSARKLDKISEDALLDFSMEKLFAAINMGTGAIEIKSGYGLSVENELKMLRVIAKIKELSPIPVKATFLGAHAIPLKYKNDKQGYIRLIIDEMLPEIEAHQLADYIDIFIEEGFYSVEDAEMVLEAGVKHGLKPRIHVDQLHSLGGIDVALKYGAISVDHLENITDRGIQTLKSNPGTIATLLPSCSFYLNMKYPPARELIRQGIPVSIASDFNPGSSPSANLNFSMSLACIYMKMTPQEALNAVSINAAHALELAGSLGSIVKGNKANLIVTEKIPSLAYVPYSFGRNPIDKMIINGEFINQR